MHAAVCWAVEHDVPCDPHTLTLVFLVTRDEEHLSFEMERLGWYGIRGLSYFCEPDLNDELTAFAIGEQAGRRLSHLPLWEGVRSEDGREHVMAASESCSAEAGE